MGSENRMSMTVSLSQNDWSLHRKGPIDQARHNEKVKDAIKGNLGSIVGDESIITADGNKIVKVPIRSLELPFLKPKGRHEIESETVRFNEIRRRGIMSNLDKKRTITENLRRNARLG